ncbi:MAG: 4Fe-4S binding protein [Candidatus Omnitrophota bacterium]|nr:4Fe-4S binding protein [Candidatus Omnitrophota bacterium]
MAKLKINKNRCKGCLLCITYCPKGLLKKSQSLNKLGIQPVIFVAGRDSCIGCSFCAIICPECCIEIFK